MKLGNYLDWMKTCYYVTSPAIRRSRCRRGSRPSGLPVGLQIVGRYRDDFGVLQLAAAFEQATKSEASPAAGSLAFLQLRR